MYILIDIEWFEENKDKFKDRYNKENNETGKYLISELDVAGLVSKVDWADDTLIDVEESDSDGHITVVVSAELDPKFVFDSMKWYLDETTKHREAIKALLKSL